MALKKFKKFLVRHPFQAVILFGILGVIIGSVALVAQPAGSGFLNWNLRSVNQYVAGSPELGESGVFKFSQNGVTWEGKVQPGNIYYLSKTDLGWAHVNGVDIAQSVYWFRGDLLAHTLCTYTDMMPGATIENQWGGWQYSYVYYDGLGVPKEMTFNYWMAKGLTLPTGWSALLQQQLQMNIGVNIYLDPTLLLGDIPREFNTTTWSYQFSGLWAGILRANADPETDYRSGFISEPAAIISTHFLAPTDVAPVSEGAVSNPAGSPAPSTATGNYITSVDTTGRRFNVDVVSQTTASGSSGAIEQGMGRGDPISLYTRWENNTLGNTFGYELLNDTVRTNVIGYVPITLRPQTDIIQTEYVYNNFAITNSFWNLANNGYSSSNSLGVHTTMYTGATVKNVFVIQPIQFGVMVCTNYTGVPLQSSTDFGNPLYEPETGIPNVDGTGNVFNGDVTNKITDVSGNAPFGLADLLNFLAEWGIWILIAVIAVVVVIIIIKVSGKGGNTLRIVSGGRRR